MFGFYAPAPADARCAYFGLHSLQHRGQESAGIAYQAGKSIECYKNVGLVSDVLAPRLDLLRHRSAVIGHVRYSTYGGNTVLNAQPLLGESCAGQLAVAHNGQLLNAARLRKDLQNRGAVFQTQNDSEVFLHLMARYAHLPFALGVQAAVKDVRGSYALLLLAPGKMAAVRDPMGIRPLCLGRLHGGYVVASETCALDAAGAEFIRDVRPGEILLFENGQLTSLGGSEEPAKGICLFEYVYLARPDSVLDSISVAESRFRAGQALALAAPVEADLVAGVPDSALTAAMGYAQSAGIPYGDALVKNRYVGRTFIQPRQSMRELSVKMKLNALAANVKGKRIVLVDDSIVRGTTSQKLVEQLKAAGAREVHLRISSPPVNYPCFFGINTPSRRQLIAARLTPEALCKKVGADTLYYLTLPELKSAVKNGSPHSFCTGCFDGRYALDIAGKRKGLGKQ